jgi:hypothetical protein
MSDLKGNLGTLNSDMGNFKKRRVNLASLSKVRPGEKQSPSFSVPPNQPLPVYQLLKTELLSLLLCLLWH